MRPTGPAGARLPCPKHGRGCAAPRLCSHFFGGIRRHKRPSGAKSRETPVGKPFSNLLTAPPQARLACQRLIYFVNRPSGAGSIGVAIGIGIDKSQRFSTLVPIPNRHRFNMRIVGQCVDQASAVRYTGSPFNQSVRLAGNGLPLMSYAATGSNGHSKGRDEGCDQAMHRHGRLPLVNKSA